MPPTTPATPSRNSFTVPLAIIIAGGMIAAAVYFGAGNHTLSPGSKPTDSTPAAKVEPVSASDHLLGNKDAPVVVVEYSDLECPFCKAFHSTMHQIVDAYQGKVAWVYRHFPIAQLHSRAPKEAEAAECAYDQGGNDIFWKYIDKVFATTGTNNTLDPADLPKFAKDFGLDVAKFNDCLSKGIHTADISKAIDAAVAAGAQGTPYSVIMSGDKKIEVNGAEPFESVKAKIDSLLK